MRALSIIIALLACAACRPAWEEASDYSLEVGIGYDDFASYDDIGELQMERGFQGGQHLNVALRAEGPRTTRTSSAPRSSSTTTRCSRSPRPSGAVSSSRSVRSCCGPPVDSTCALLGRELELRVTVWGPGDEVGRAWSRAEVTFMPDSVTAP